MHGLSTLNRLLGKKNKEVSRSTSNLSKTAHSTLDTSSQHKKISPILNNAPFEQTFRVTVYLPKDQLYVERIGAKTKLARLMNDVCDNKNLNADKFEFRHPTDLSQVFDNEKTIGEVGFNELRLILKTESRYNGDFHRYHTEDMMKYKPSNAAESVSSSEFSRNLKNVTKTSPYSSTNSLNSLDSTGMNSTGKQPPVAPMRKKKRMAPRPPSENSSIPEQEIFGTLNVFKEPHSILPRKNFHVSSPQLYNNAALTKRNEEIGKMNDSNNNNTELRPISSRLNAITRPSSLYITRNSEIVKNLPEHTERQRNNSESSEIQNILRDSGSKQNSLERTKKKSPAPVPPNRKSKPTPSPRTTQEDNIKTQSITEIMEVDEQENVIYQEQRHVKIEEIPNDNFKSEEDNNGNISKVLLNNSEGPSSVVETDGPISIQIISTETTTVHEHPKENESAKLPVVSKVHINHPDDEIRSSEEEEMTVNIYNVTKSVVTCEKPTIIKETKQVSVVEEKHTIVENIVVKDEITTTIIKEERQRSPSPTWTYTLPAPPLLNDSITMSNTSPTDRPGKIFSEYTATVVDNETVLSDSNTTITVSSETNIFPVINDRRSEQRGDGSFIINSSDYAKPIDNVSDKSAEIITSDLEDGYLVNNNNNSNSGSTNINTINIVKTPIEKNRMENEIIVEDLQRSRIIISRSDSFHSIGQQKKNDYELRRVTNINALPQRSTSFLSLVHAQKAEKLSNNKNITDNNVPYSKQKSTSELSISDVPSLQSLEVIKNILNSSRKNSLQDHPPTSASDDDSKKSLPTIQSAPIQSKKGEKIETKKVIDELKEKTILRNYESQKSAPAVEVKKKPEVSNQWRYSGPPKINFSTWSERPKVEVAVMSDEDYIFGGVAAATSPRSFKNQENEPTFPSQSMLKKTGRNLIEKDGNETQKHLPKVLHVEYKKDITPTVVSKPIPVSTDYGNGNVNTSTSAKSTNFQNSSTQFVSYNRLSTNHKKFTPIVHGFSKLDNINEVQGDVKLLPTTNKIMNVNEKKAEAPPIIPTKPSYLRSTSAGDINRKMKSMSLGGPIEISKNNASSNINNNNNDNNNDYDEAPFSQSLRRTGLIEKMLTNDKKTESMFGRVLDKPKYDNHSNVEVEEKIAKVTMRQHSHPIPVPPPSLPPTMAFRKSAPLGESVDNRSQLLDAIKTFNKDSLRRK